MGQRHEMTAITAAAWMELYGTSGAPGPEETGWTGFSHPTRKQWAALRATYTATLAKRTKVSP